MPETLAALVLAGGRGTRLAGLGGDKAFVTLGSEGLLAQVLARLPAGRTAISGNGDPARFSMFGLPVLPDLREDRPGPLAGILAGLAWAASLDPRPSHLLTVPTDTPFLPTDLVERLHAVAQGAPRRVIIAATQDGLQQAVALWPLTAASALGHALAAGEHRVLAAASAQGLLAVPFLERGPGGIDPFFNINTPAELKLAERVLRGGRARTPALAIVGWKNSGKTTLTERLVRHFTEAGLSVATVKHAHHGFTVDQPGTDSDRHRVAGASSVTIVSPVRIARLRELNGATEPDIEEILAAHEPVDLIIAEGFKRAALRKLEVRRGGSSGTEVLSEYDPWVGAIAADHALADPRVPVFDLDAVGDIAAWIHAEFKLG